MIAMRSAILSILLLLTPSASAVGSSIRGRNLGEITWSWDLVGEAIEGQEVDDNAGNAVAINSAGDVIAVAATVYDHPTLDGTAGANWGHVRIFKQVDGSWVQLGSSILGAEALDRSGYQVSLNSAGDVVAISAQFHDGAGGSNSGHVRVFQYDEGTNDWYQKGTDLDGPSAQAMMESVALDGSGNRVVIGSSRHDVGEAAGNTKKGQVRVYDWDSSVGAQDWDKIGNTLNGEDDSDLFGGSVSISDDGSRIAVGSTGADCTADTYNNCGSVSVFEYSDATGNVIWNQLGDDIMGPGAVSDFGGAVALSGDGTTVASGASRLNTYTGQVQVYKYEGGSWGQAGATIVGEGTFDRFGSSLTLSTDGSVVAIGAWANDGIPGKNSGHVQVYRNENNAWVQLGIDVEGTDAQDGFGSSVAISSDGTRIIAGAPDRAGPEDEYRGRVRVFQYTMHTEAPSSAPSESPAPSNKPSAQPSSQPSGAPSVSPSKGPTGTPSGSPSLSMAPTKAPTPAPTPKPTEEIRVNPQTESPTFGATPTPAPILPGDAPTPDCIMGGETFVERFYNSQVAIGKRFEDTVTGFMSRFGFRGSPADDGLAR